MSVQTETRARWVGEAIVSSRLEGVEPTPAFLADASDYAAGRIGASELIDRVRRRWAPATPTRA